MFSIKMGTEEVFKESYKVNYRHAVRAVIIKGNKILMVHTNKGDYKLPGGGLEEKEDFEEALKREVQEETGYILSKIKKYIGIAIQRKEDVFEKNTLFEMKSTYYLCEVSDEKERQELDDYELEQEFTPVWIEINKAIENNVSLLNEKDKNPWVEREIKVLRELLYLEEKIEMNINFKEVNKLNKNEFENIAKWMNIEEFKYLITPNFQEDALPIVTVDELFENSSKDENKYIFLILDGDKEIGDISINIDPPYLAKKESKTGWIGICIGNKKYHGTEASISSINFLEDKCRKLGLKRIELGVFEFNKRAINFYEKMGYKTFERFEKFTFFNGEWFDDIRMEKYL